MSLLESIILGIVEGLTEFLPVSSTGHLLLTNRFLGLESQAADAYVIVIQLGAILAVIGYYRVRLWSTFASAAQAGSSGRKLLINLIIAFCPAAAAGLLFEDFIEQKLMRSDIWIAAALIIGGIIMIIAEKCLRPQKRAVQTLDQITPIDAFCIGIAQCLALWPGMSRSMSTIVGGQLRGFTNNLAADFSFLLAIPTLGAATLYKLISDRAILLSMPGGWLNLIVGILASFIVAWLAIAVFLKMIKHTGMSPFGIYRIIIGIFVLWIIAG